MEMVKSPPKKEKNNSESSLRVNNSPKLKPCASSTISEVSLEMMIWLIRKNSLRHAQKDKRMMFASRNQRSSLKKVKTAKKPSTTLMLMEMVKSPPLKVKNNSRSSLLRDK